MAISRNFHGLQSRKLAEHGHVIAEGDLDGLGHVLNGVIDGVPGFIFTGDFEFYGHFCRSEWWGSRPWFQRRSLGPRLRFQQVNRIDFLQFHFTCCCCCYAMTAQKRGPSKFRFWGNFGSSPKMFLFWIELWYCTLSKNEYLQCDAKDNRYFGWLKNNLISK